MFGTFACFKCGELGHLKANCPERRTPAAKAPAAVPAKADGEKKHFTGVPHPRAPEEIADAHSWANRIREADPRLGEPHCGDDSDLVATPFRRVTGLGAAHGCRLRALAARQAVERTAAA
jgi:Zinc knuckle